MTPRVEDVLRDIAQQISEQICPDIDGYHRGTLSMAAMMLTMAADEWDCAAQNRVEENRAIRALLIKALPFVPEEAATRYRILALQEEEDLRISMLDEENKVLRAAIMEAQITLEESTNSDARSLQADIWNELLRGTERRRVSAAPF